MSGTKRILGQRDTFFEALFEIFKQDRDCVIVTADNGAPSLDQFTELPGQFYQVGIAEQQMIGMAAGLATEGKKVWTYCIAPFATTRVHEFVKLNLCAAKLPITVLGVGAGFTYSQMGPSHHTLEDISIMRACPGLEIYSPADSIVAAELAQLSYDQPKSRYIRFDRAGIPDIYTDTVWNVDDGFIWHEPPLAYRELDGAIIATGIMVHTALQVAKALSKQLLNLGVMDVFRVVPIPWEAILKRCIRRPLITLEEHFLSGGLGSIVSEKIHDGGHSNSLLRIGVPDVYHFEPWGREEAWLKYGLDVESIVKRIKEWL